MDDCHDHVLVLFDLYHAADRVGHEVYRVGADQANADDLDLDQANNDCVHDLFGASDHDLYLCFHDDHGLDYHDKNHVFHDLDLEEAIYHLFS